jgi:hypothetical protein
MTQPFDDRIDSDAKRAHLAALEALFTPKPAEAAPAPAPAPSKRDSAKMVVARPRGTDDPRARQLEARLLAAEGCTQVTRVAEDFDRAGFAPADEQEVQLKLLEHADEARVRSALEALARILVRESPRRRPVLDARLRRLEDDAEEAATRTLATSLRRGLATRGR